MQDANAARGTVTVRDACGGDIPAVAALETVCFSRPFRADDFAAMLTDPARTLLVAEADGAFCGYIGAYTVLDESDITTVAVLPAMRGRGAGRALVRALTEKVGGKVFLEVRVSNAPARALYASLGFAECGTRKNYYESPREDAVLYCFSGAAKG